MFIGSHSLPYLFNFTLVRYLMMYPSFFYLFFGVSLITIRACVPCVLKPIYSFFSTTHLLRLESSCIYILKLKYFKNVSVFDIDTSRLIMNSSQSPVSSHIKVSQSGSLKTSTPLISQKTNATTNISKYIYNFKYLDIWFFK